MGTYWSAHTHSKFSVGDALPGVSEIVEKAKELNYPALGLTDHGNISGTVQLYKHCRKNDIKPLPGSEMYLSWDIEENKRTKKSETMHLGVLATSAKGYKNLVYLSSLSHLQFYRKPTLDFNDLAYAYENGMLEGLAVMTGCWFGMASEILKIPSKNVDIQINNVLQTMSKWFDNNLYVEIQNHGIQRDGQDEDTHAELMYQLAQKHSLPVVITQDSHYINQEEQHLHDVLKDIISWDKTAGAAAFPGDGYHLVDDEWMQMYHPKHIYDAGIQGLDDLYNKSNVVIPELDTFKLFVPDTTKTKNPEKELEQLSKKMLEIKFSNKEIESSRKEEYFERLELELDIINNTDFAGYIMYLRTTCEFMKKSDIIYNARGSASGSLVCWLLEITPVDPIHYKLLIDRFLTKDRTNPPDIDLDVEHDRRSVVIDWLNKNYIVYGISTWAKLGAKHGEDDAEKYLNEYLEDSDDQELSGSLIVKLKQSRTKRGEDRDAPISDELTRDLMQLAIKEPYSSYGKHAAGLIVLPNREILRSVPLMCIGSSHAIVSGYDKNDAEALGLLKIDLLGLKTLSALRIMQEYTGVKRSEIPLDDMAVFKKITFGETSGVFQLEGKASRSGVQDLRPRSINDIIAAMALFRPGALISRATADFISRRSKRKAIPARHEIISSETEDTYGVILYQEQVISVMRRVGLSSDEIEKVRKIIKSSKGDNPELKGLQKKVAELAKEKKMSAADIKWLNEAFKAYANYGFNKAHATSYGIIAYQTAYYSTHYPVAYWAAMLEAYTGSDPQEEMYLKATRKEGIEILPPHVNESALKYKANKDQTAILSGLTSIKGIGEPIAKEILRNAPFTSLDDLAIRVNGTIVTGSNALGQGIAPEECPGTINQLFAAGALEGLEREKS